MTLLLTVLCVVSLLASPLAFFVGHRMGWDDRGRAARGTQA